MIAFLGLDEALAIHADQIDRYGGDPGLRDRGLLESALAQPRASFGGEFLHQDVFEMAAAYLYHIALNHPFVDGNKRAALASALVFLEINGHLLPADTDAFYDLTIAVAQGQCEKPAIAAFFRERVL